jgi:CRP-like cAMP-binding protein
MDFRNKILSLVPEDDIAVLLGGLKEVSLNQGEYLLKEGDTPEYIFFPSTCVTSVVTVMRDGRSVETSTIGFESAPAILSVLTGTPTINRIFTQVSGSAMRMSATAIRRQASESPRLLQLLLKFAQVNAYQAELSVACNALHHLDARLARWLLLTQDRSSTASLPLTQELLAVMLGVQRTSVTTSAMALKKRGFITYTRGNITIIDREKLLTVACECYSDGGEIPTKVISRH